MPHPAPEYEIIERLKGFPCRGTFEAHITTDASDATASERFRVLCGELGVKCVLIELPEGAARSQPMTASYHHGDLASVLEEVTVLAARVRAAGFAVVRLKLEAVATNDGVPETDEEASALPPENYFEFHLKLLLPAGADLEAARACCARHDGRLSRNAAKRDADGAAERFVTLRVYHCGRRRAFERFDRLAEELASAGYALGNRLREYTIYDSAVSLDAGWIGPSRPAGASP